MQNTAIANTTAPETDATLMHWIFGSLSKHGSYEDYLFRLAERTRKGGWPLSIYSGPGAHPAVVSTLERHGAQLVFMSQDELNSVPRFVSALKSVKPKIVHFHFGSPSTALAPVARMVGGARVVISDHGSRRIESGSLFNPLTGLKKLRRRTQAEFVDAYFPVSNYVGHRIECEIGVDKSRIHRLLNGIDTERFRPAADQAERDRLRRSLFGVGPNALCVLYAGQIVAEKGVGKLLSVQRRMLDMVPDAVMIWAGDGPMASMINDDPEGRVRFLGARNDIPDLLRAADIVVTPSVWNEAFALILAEAAATALPVVATRIGGIPEVVEDTVTGLLIAPGDDAALLQSLVTLLNDKNLRTTMGQAARDRAVRLFDLETMLDETLTHYVRLLSKNAPTPVGIGAIPAPSLEAK